MAALSGHARLVTAGALLPCALLAFAAVPASAQDVPMLRGRITDLAQLLPAERARALDARLAEHERQTGQQFALLTVSSLQGQSIEQLGIAVAEKWKLGDARRDDGLILLVARDERELRIEVGYGLEGVIPDAVAARVIREVIVPALQRGDYSGGIEAGFAALIERAGGKPAQRPAPSARRERGGASTLLLLIVFLVFPLMRAVLGLGRGGRGYRRGGYGALGAGLGGWRAGGLGGGFRGGGGGFGGGGGGFGGGGASGRW